MEADLSFQTVVLPAESSTALEQALSWLRRGQVVVFPTDTVYGLGAPMEDVGAVERLFRVKGRPRPMGIPLLLAEAGDVERVCQQVPDLAWRLMERFWPGGLTLVLWRKPVVPDVVTGGRATVAVRLPAHHVPRELAGRLGGALAATSANRSGASSPVMAAEVQAQLGGRIPLILDGGRCPAEQPSTIVDLTVDPPSLLRIGPVGPGEIEAVLGRLCRSDRS